LKAKEKPFDEKSDVWGMGMVLYEMLTLQLPYKEVGLFDCFSHKDSSEESHDLFLA